MDGWMMMMTRSEMCQRGNQPCTYGAASAGRRMRGSRAGMLLRICAREKHTVRVSAQMSRGNWRLPAPIRDHVEDRPEARALPHCSCDLAVDGVEERRYAVEECAQLWVVAHVDERDGGEDDARVSCERAGERARGCDTMSARCSSDVVRSTPVRGHAPIKFCQ
jgi:hypothetical protein